MLKKIVVVFLKLGFNWVPCFDLAALIHPECPCGRALNTASGVEDRRGRETREASERGSLKKGAPFCVKTPGPEW